jgi:hypothetical protein
MTYPKDLSVHGRALCISPLGFNVDDRFSSGTQERAGYIFLPIPYGLRTAYNANWGQTELGVIGGEAVQQIKNGNMDLNELAGAAGAKVMQNIGTSLSEYVGIDANKITSAALKGIINPNYALIFMGSEFRSFNFSYKLIARNAEESNQILNIVRALKYYMSPSEGGSSEQQNQKKTFTSLFQQAADKAFGEGNEVVESDFVRKTLDTLASNFLAFPNLFRLDFLTSSQDVLTAQAGGDAILDNSFNQEKNKYLFQPGICALRSLEVDYSTENGTPAFFKETGAPITVSIAMSFIETEIVTKESIDNRKGPS